MRLPESVLDRKPSSLSGGQCQRVGLARALALRPSLVVLDESLSALDMATRSSIVGLLETLQSRHNMAYLFISHDLGLVQSIAHRIYVIKQGHVVEHGTAEYILQQSDDAYVNRLKETVLKIGDFRWNS